MRGRAAGSRRGGGCPPPGAADALCACACAPKNGLQGLSEVPYLILQSLVMVNITYW